MKYSIIIPCRNGGKYLPTCVETIIRQNYSDYELIISDDHSTDNTSEYLKTLSCPQIKVLTPPKELSMAEHWEWALSHAIGEWLIFVGQDDGLQLYFFELVEKLTSYANELRIRTITCERADYYWPGCDCLYGTVALGFSAIPKIKIKSTSVELVKSLLGFKCYFELPQMYTTSLWHKDLISEVLKKQGGELFTSHPQDANLAALACCIEKKYLHSLIPFGWVGSSPKSAGMAVNAIQNGDVVKDPEIEAVRKEYIKKTSSSNLHLHPFAGNFSFGSCAVYLMGTVLKTQKITKRKIVTIVSSKFFRMFILAGALSEMYRQKHINFINRLKYFDELITANKVNMNFVKIISEVYNPVYQAYVVWKKVKRRYNLISGKSINYFLTWDNNKNIDLLVESDNVKNMIFNKGYLKKI